MHAPADAAPKSGWYEPAPHGTHEEALVLPLVLLPCVPGRHGMHADTPLAPVVGLYEPLGQSAQAAAVVSPGVTEYRPGPHPMHAAADVAPTMGWYVPAAHCTHDAGATENVPAGHVPCLKAQVALPGGLKNDPGQVLHVLLVLPEDGRKEPAGHGLHAVALSTSLHEPAAQRAQPPLGCPKKPTAQGAHDALPGGEANPGWQNEHAAGEEAPLSALNVFAAQSVISPAAQ